VVIAVTERFTDFGLLSGSAITIDPANMATKPTKLVTNLFLFMATPLLSDFFEMINWGFSHGFEHGCSYFAKRRTRESDGFMPRVHGFAQG
jgi:hypothetical protein